MNSFEQDHGGRWEQAVAGRLSKLRTLPVDTGRLAAALQGEIPRPVGRTRRMWLAVGSVRAVAAGIVVVGALAAVMLVATTGRPAMASAAQVAQLHEELVSGKVPAVRVDSIDAANRLLAGEHADFPDLPDMPADHVMACCMTSVKDKKVACVLMKREGVPVSMMVARSEDLRVPASPVTERDGIRYHVQSSGKLNMVTSERGGRCVCVIGELPLDRVDGCCGAGEVLAGSWGSRRPRVGGVPLVGGDVAFKKRG
jgi:hypothetical protein